MLWTTRETETETERQSGEEKKGKWEGRLQAVTLIGLCVYSCTVFPSHHCILTHSVSGLGRKGLYCLLPTPWSSQTQRLNHLYVTCIWHLAWIRCSTNVCCMINMTFYLMGGKSILPPALKILSSAKSFFGYNWEQSLKLIEDTAFTAVLFSKWLP